MHCGRPFRAIGLIAVVLSTLAPASVSAQPQAGRQPSSPVHQVQPAAEALGVLQQVHHSYTARDGAPPVVAALAQTRDGFLWLGSPTGLARFDGVAFDASYTERLPSSNVYSLYSDGEDLWIGYGFGGVSRLHRGQLTNYPMDGLPGGGILAFARRPDGVLWAASTKGLMRMAHGHWQAAGPEFGLPSSQITWLTQTDGSLWLMTVDGAYVLPPGATRFLPIDRERARRGRLRVPNEALWRPDAPYRDYRFPLVDATGAVWNAAAGGLEQDRWVPGQPAPLVQKFTPQQGLSSDTVITILQGREGDVWVGTTRGLDQFRAGKFTPVSSPVPLAIPGIAADDKGGLWIGNSAGSAIHVQGRTVQAVPALGKQAWCVASDHTGAIWMAGITGLKRWANGTVTDIPLPDALAGLDIDPLSGHFQAIAVDADGSLWLSVASYNLYRRKDGHWTEQGGLAGLPPGPAIRLLTDDAGRLWFAYPDNRIVMLDHGHLKTFTHANGLAVGNVLAIDVRGDQVWAAGDLGVAHLKGDRFVPLVGAHGETFSATAGIVQTPDGELWFDSTAGVYRVSAAEVRRVSLDPTHKVAFDLFDQDDGLLGPSLQIRPGPTLRQGPGPHGRLWVARLDGVSWIDPTHVPANPLAPVVSIEALHAADRGYPLATGLVLPKLTRNLRFDYTAPSLTLPQRVSFRYRLDGADSDWQDAGARRQAFYTNLGPGDYRFRVRAANEDGVWSAREAVYDFRIAAAFYQTTWFMALGGCLALAGLWLLYLLRMRQLAARAQIRTAERERIARDLHDTLLQSIQGLQLRLQTWAADPSLETRRRNEMSDVAARTRDMLIDGRDRIVALRHAGMPQTDLLAGLQATGEEYASMYPARFHLHVEGEPRPLQPEVAAEILDIVREGLRNAFVHAGAALIELSVTWHRRALCILVCDDGSGIDEAILREGGRPGHWGLLGMRERAMRIGARLRLQRRGMGGTELYVEVPARRAYAGLRLWRRWRRRDATPA